MTDRLRLCCRPAALLLCGVVVMSMPLRGQTSIASLTLPNAPDGVWLASEPTATATLSGRVTDANGSPLEGAAVKLTAPTLPSRSLVSDAQGAFTFRSVVPGTYLFEITYTGLRGYENAALVLEPNQTVTLPVIPLALNGTSTVVQVTATPIEVADAQVEEQLHQRLLGVIPNFYTTYIWDAEPLNKTQKFRLATNSVLDPVAFLTTGLAAGGQQIVNAYGQYGDGVEGYAKRYGADYADIFIGRMLSSAVFPSLFHEDPRYFYKGDGTVRRRALYAMERSVITRDDHGHNRLGYSRVLGFFAAGAIANVYHPSNDRGLGLTLSNASIALGGSAVDNLFREFLWRKLTKNVPVEEQGEKSATPPTPGTPRRQ